MTPEQQRIAIAEACGWEPTPEGHFHPDNPTGQTPPNYLTDLNAMHEAEKVLTQQQRIEYVRELVFIWTGRNDRAIPNWWFVHDATASQRAEAFLRTIGKWEESK